MDFERILSSLWLDKFDKFVPFSFYWSKRNTFKKKILVCSLREVFVRVENFAFHVSRRFFVKNNFCELIVTFSSSFEFWGGKIVDFQRKVSNRIAKIVFFMSRGVVAGKQIQWKLFNFWWPFGFWADFFFWRKFQEVFSQLHSTCSHKSFH